MDFQTLGQVSHNLLAIHPEFDVCLTRGVVCWQIWIEADATVEEKRAFLNVRCPTHGVRRARFVP